MKQSLPSPETVYLSDAQLDLVYTGCSFARASLTVGTTVRVLVVVKRVRKISHTGPRGQVFYLRQSQMKRVLFAKHVVSLKNNGYVFSFACSFFTLSTFGR